jgi:hypothetical protein
MLPRFEKGKVELWPQEAAFHVSQRIEERQTFVHETFGFLEC